MKKILFGFIVCIISLGACKSSSNEDKAKELISQYIKNNANDPDSYEAVEFGKLEDVTEYPVYKYKMLHKFRANNSFGAKVLHETYFYITDDWRFAEPLNEEDSK